MIQPEAEDEEISFPNCQSPLDVAIRPGALAKGLEEKEELLLLMFFCFLENEFSNLVVTAELLLLPLLRLNLTTDSGLKPS